MPKIRTRIPSYRLHRPSGRAVVTLNNQDFYLGPHGSEESQKEYQRLIEEWLANHRQLTPERLKTRDLAINELVVAYWEFAQVYYVKNGRASGEQPNIRDAFRPLVELYGDTLVQEFGPLCMKAVRQKMIEADLCRRVINSRVNRIRRIFKWGVENELVKPDILHGLQAVTPLKKGRSPARESPGVQPVPEAHVNVILGLVFKPVRAMIALQELTGMRPGEVVIMRGCDLDTTGKIWSYRPSSHKTEHHEISRVIYLGPRAQEVIRPYWKPDLSAYLFSPQDAMEEWNAARRRNRKTPMTPSQAGRTRRESPRKTPGDHYTVGSYRRAIQTACKKAGVPCWFPHQLRHNAATWLRKEFGLEAARVVLGHSSAAVTEIYAEIDQMKAAEIMMRVG